MGMEAVCLSDEKNADLSDPYRAVSLSGTGILSDESAGMVRILRRPGIRQKRIFSNRPELSADPGRPVGHLHQPPIF